VTEAEAVEGVDEAQPLTRAAQLALLDPGRAAFQLAWPGIIEQLIRASGQTVVIAFIGHLGGVAIAAVGASLQFTFLLFPVFNALSIGTVALVSRRMGERRAEAASDVVRQSLVLGAVLGILTGALFAIFAKPLLGLIGADEAVSSAGAPYLALIGGLNVFQTISIIGVSAMRAAGDTRTPMWLSAAGSALTVPATYLLVTVAGLGIMGAAYAQIVVSVLFCAGTIALLWRGVAGVRISGGAWRLERATMRSLASISGYSAGESFLFSIGILALGFLAFRLGTEAYAAHQLVAQLESLSFLPCVGFSAASAALVGQSLGMRDPKRAMRSAWAATRMAIVWTAAVGAILALFPRFFLGIFTSDQGVITAGVGALIVIGFAQPAQAVNFTMGGALRGSGDTRFTLATTTINWFVVRLPLAVLFTFSLGLGLAGIWLAVLVDYCVRAVILSLRFRSGRWAKRVL
jgi:putative MATE family efflux protein